MLPPVGVQASVLSHDTIKVTWADNSLAKNQRVTDARTYTVRWKTNIPANTKFKVRKAFRGARRNTEAPAVSVVRVLLIQQRLGRLKGAQAKMCSA